jgi:hypothetical protein
MVRPKRQGEDACWRQVFATQPSQCRVFAPELRAAKEGNRALSAEYDRKDRDEVGQATVNKPWTAKTIMAIDRN